jgi:hypothetical protein
MKKEPVKKFASEAAMVEAYCVGLKKQVGDPWTAYHETAGWDVLLVQQKTGVQVGLEAKLALNLHVLAQALPEYEDYDRDGPDYRGVLVPSYAVQPYLAGIAARLGLGVEVARLPSRFIDWGSTLPDETNDYSHGLHGWFPWLPTQRCALPDYVPDVTGGKAAPVKLTHWKIKALKLMILLDRRGYVTRTDMKALGISASHWTQRGGWLVPRDGAYVRWERTPDFSREHPVNYAEIAADFEKWAPPAQPRQRFLIAAP